MQLVSTVQLAIRAIGRNRLRSALTLVGITIGVAVVIVMVAIGTGAQQAIEQQVRAAGANLVTVTAGNYSPGNQDPSSGDVAEGELAGGAGVSGSTTAHKSTAAAGWAGMSVSPRVAGPRRLHTAHARRRRRHRDAGAGRARSRRPVSPRRAVMCERQDRHLSAACRAPTRRCRRCGHCKCGPARSSHPTMSRPGRGAGADARRRQRSCSARVPSAVDKGVQIRQTVFTVVGVAARSAGWRRQLPPRSMRSTRRTRPCRTLLKIAHLHSVRGVGGAGRRVDPRRRATSLVLLRARHALGAARS